MYADTSQPADQDVLQVGSCANNFTAPSIHSLDSPHDGRRYNPTNQGQVWGDESAQGSSNNNNMSVVVKQHYH